MLRRAGIALSGRPIWNIWLNTSRLLLSSLRLHRVRHADPWRLHMEEPADVLRRRIAVYRRYLTEGADSELARRYPRQIAADNAELERLERDTDRRE